MRQAAILSAIFAAITSSSALADVYEDCVAAKLDPSLGIISRMGEDKLDLGRARQVSQLFLGPKDSLRNARSALQKSGYIIAEQADGRLLATQDFAANQAWVRMMIPQMCKIAADSSVEYDGWDIDVAADHITSDNK